MNKKAQYSFLLLFFGLLLSAEDGWLGNNVFSQCTLTANSLIGNITCYGANDGAVIVNATGGNLPYTYSWSNGNTTSSISNLAAGNYSVIVTDSSCSLPGPELVANGNFSTGNSFWSGYSYCNSPNCLLPDATYALGNNPSFFHSAFC